MDFPTFLKIALDDVPKVASDEEYARLRAETFALASETWADLPPDFLENLEPDEVPDLIASARLLIAAPPDR